MNDIPQARSDASVARWPAGMARQPRAICVFPQPADLVADVGLGIEPGPGDPRSLRDAGERHGRPRPGRARAGPGGLSPGSAQHAADQQAKINALLLELIDVLARLLGRRPLPRRPNRWDPQPPAPHHRPSWRRAAASESGSGRIGGCLLSFAAVGFEGERKQTLQIITAAETAGHARVAEMNRQPRKRPDLTPCRRSVASPISPARTSTSNAAEPCANNVAANTCPSLLLAAHGPGHLTCFPRHCVRSMFHCPCSPRFASFPPPPPQPQPCSAGSQVIPVGTALAGGPPDRSRRAELPHRAPALGPGGEAHAGVGMHDAGRG